MTKPRVLRGDWLLIPPDIAAEWSPVVMAAIDTFSPDATEAAQRHELMGAWHEKTISGVSSVSSDLSSLAVEVPDPEQWVTVSEAAKSLNITPQAVTGRLGRGTLRGIQLADRSWRVAKGSE
jgi:hypothetical protein